MYRVLYTRMVTNIPGSPLRPRTHLVLNVSNLGLPWQFHVLMVWSHTPLQYILRTVRSSPTAPRAQAHFFKCSGLLDRVYSLSSAPPETWGGIGLCHGFGFTVVDWQSRSPPVLHCDSRSKKQRYWTCPVDCLKAWRAPARPSVRPPGRPGPGKAGRFLCQPHFSACAAGGVLVIIIDRGRDWPEQAEGGRIKPHLDKLTS